MLEKGDILQNRYRIIRELGRGRMGAVYEAEDNQRLGNSVVLKEISVDLKDKDFEYFRLVFEREANVLREIDHETLPEVIDYFLETDRQFLVMELIEGEDLDEISEKRQKPFPLANVLNWADQLLDALDYLHTLRQPIIHRDIKPQNLKLTPPGKIKLLDFGITADTDAEIAPGNVPQKAFLGATLYYSPIEKIVRIPDYFDMLESVYPEKAKKIVHQSIDARSDIYALGATLYHLLTNSFPRPAHLRVLEIWAGRQDSLKSLHELNADISPEISEWLQKALEIEREDRFVSAFEMQTALQEALSHEKRRINEGERNLRLAEQAKIRDQIETERSKLDEESQSQQKYDSEAERRRQEEAEHEAKLSQWKRDNLSFDALSDEKKSFADTMVFMRPTPLENLPVENTSNSVKAAEMKPLMETGLPLFADNSNKFEAEKLPPAPIIINHTTPQTAPVVTAPTSIPKKPLWILPAGVAAFLIFGIAVFGMFMAFSNSGEGGANKVGKNPEAVLPTALPTASPTISPTVSPGTTPAQSVSENDKSKTTVAPTVNKTPVPNTAKTPVVQKTEKPTKTPNLSDECVYNGKCR